MISDFPINDYSTVQIYANPSEAMSLVEKLCLLPNIQVNSEFYQKYPLPDEKTTEKLR